VGTPFLQQISLIDNGVLDEIEETPAIKLLTFKGKFFIVYGGSGLVLVGLLDFKSSGGR
jgi:hypothetical protein